MKKTFEHTISQAQKEANDFEWYKHFIDKYCNRGEANIERIPGTDPGRWGTFTENRKRYSTKANYDLFNNILDVHDMRRSTSVFSIADDIPEDITNKDIFSPKIKALMGLVGDRTFKWRIYPLNQEATNRIEEERNNRYKKYVEAMIMQPIIEQQTAILRQREADGGSAGNAGQGSKTQEEIQKELEQMIIENTPDSIEKYMARKHNDPVQILCNQMLNFGMRKEYIREKTEKGWKHALLSGKEFYLIMRTSSGIKVISLDPLHTSYDISQDEDAIENGEWASYTFYQTPSAILSLYGDKLTTKQKNDLMNYRNNNGRNANENLHINRLYDDTDTGIAVTYVCFRSLKKIGFLTYLDEETGKVEETIVNDTYVMVPENGDLVLDWEWIPQVHHGMRIDSRGEKIYINMEPLPFDTTTKDNIYDVKLPIVGLIYDNTNSECTSIADRLKVFQYQYNAIWWKIERLLASDKGKKLAIDQNLIKSGNLLELFNSMQELDLIPIPTASEGSSRTNTNTMKDRISVIDMSLTSDIVKYLELAEFIKKSSGEAIGMPQDMEGQQSQYKSGVAVDQTISSASNIIEPYFRMHNTAVRNMLELYLNALIDYYVDNPEDKAIPFVLDDMSMDILKLDNELLKTASVSLFMENSGKADKIKQVIEQLGQMAINSQKAELSDLVRIIEEEDYVSAKEILIESERKMHERLKEIEEVSKKLEAEENQKQHEREMERLNFDRETQVKLQQMKNEADMYKQAILASGFSEDQDMDGNNVRDGVDILKVGLEQMKMKNDMLKHKDVVTLKKEELRLKEKEITKKPKPSSK